MSRPLTGRPLVAGDIALYGVGIDANSTHLAGPALGPEAIRDQLHSGSANYYTEDGVDIAAVVVDVGSIAVGNEAGSESDADLVTNHVVETLRSGGRPLGMGGDHSITYPILRALRSLHADLTIVHVDAHPDLYDNFGDNRLSHASPFARIMEDGLCDRLIQVGIRTATAHQREQAQRFGVETVEARDFQEFDARSILGPIYVSIDLDGLDPAFAPGVSHLEPGGLTTRQVIDLIAGVGGPIVGADVVELNPLTDVGGVTAMVAAKLVKELAGRMSAGQTS